MPPGRKLTASHARHARPGRLSSSRGSLDEGVRLAAGRTRLLRLLTAPTVPDPAPRVLGVNEFAFRKGSTYDPVLVDVEAARVVDVLPDRNLGDVRCLAHRASRRRDHLPGPGHRLHHGGQ
jgi:hypothetical protein